MRGLLNFPSQIDQESTEDLTPAQSAKFIPPVEDAATRCPVDSLISYWGGIAPQEHPKGFNWGVFHKDLPRCPCHS